MKKVKGTTLIELLIALGISAILIAALYRIFISQHKTYAVGEQTVDVQQNARAAINRMIRDIRMAGFGNLSMVLPVTFGSETYHNVLNPDVPAAGSLTIISAVGEAAGITLAGFIGETEITVSRLHDDQNNPIFDINNRRYISIGGLESHRITSIDSTNLTITLERGLIFNHAIGTPVFAVRALTYQTAKVSEIWTLLRDENTGGGGEPQADGIEDLAFQYLDESGGNSAGTPGRIRIVGISLTARSESPDPEMKEGDGYRRRRIASMAYLRNMGLEP
jgi:prepilin-type N-terminal cleavage/methylation domain-containing protein